jgi:hypothetical protein
VDLALTQAEIHIRQSLDRSEGFADAFDFECEWLSHADA